MISLMLARYWWLLCVTVVVFAVALGCVLQMIEIALAVSAVISFGIWLGEKRLRKRKQWWRDLEDRWMGWSNKEKRDD